MIHFQILGQAGQDNALWVCLDTGQGMVRFLFDCGENTASSLPFSKVYALEHLCFSHLHMDHIAGFDSLFRQLYPRERKPNLIWGPIKTAQIMQHRFQGFLWNFHQGGPQATWQVNEWSSQILSSSRFELSEAFAQRHHHIPLERNSNLLLDDPLFTLEALEMDHHTPSLAYVLREKPKRKVNTAHLAQMGLKGGTWLRDLKAGNLEAQSLQGLSQSPQTLERELIEEVAGDSIAYLTDFILDDLAMFRLEPLLRGVQTLVCECQYLDQDLELAIKNRHMHASAVAKLAARAQVGQLILIHLSDRYKRDGWLQILAQARAVFPHTIFAKHWTLEG